MQDDMFSSVEAKPATVPPKPPAAGDGDMFSDVESQKAAAPATSPVKAQAKPPAQRIPGLTPSAPYVSHKPPGMPDRPFGNAPAAFARALGAPGSMDEWKQQADALNNQTFGQRVMNMPGMLGPASLNQIGGMAESAGSSLKQAYSEGKEGSEDIAQGNLLSGLAKHASVPAHLAAAALAPVGGGNLETAGKQFGSGDTSGGVGTTAATLLPFLAKHLGKGGLDPVFDPKPSTPAKITSGVLDKFRDSSSPHSKGEIAGALETVKPLLDNAAKDTGIANDGATGVKANIKHAQGEVTKAAQAAVGEGKTLADMTPAQKAIYDQHYKALDILKQRVTAAEAQEAAAAAKKPTPASGPFAKSPVLRSLAKFASPRVVYAADSITAIRNATAAKVAPPVLDATLAQHFAPASAPAPNAAAVASRAPVPGPDPFVKPIDTSGASAAPPSGFPSNTAAVPGSGAAPVAGPVPAGGPLTSTAQVSRTPSGFPQTDVAPPPPASEINPFERDPNVPNGYSIGQATDGAGNVTHYVSKDGDILSSKHATYDQAMEAAKTHAVKGETEAPAAKTAETPAETKAPLSKKNQAAANLAQRQRMGWRLDGDPPLPKAGARATKAPEAEPTQLPLKDTIDNLRKSLAKNKPPAEAADAEEPWRKALYEKPATTESAATSAAQNSFEKKVIGHFPDPALSPETLGKLWDKVSPHVTHDMGKPFILEGLGMETPVVDIAADKVAKIGMGPAQPIPNIPEVLQPIESGSVTGPEVESKGGMHYHIMPKATKAGTATQAEITGVTDSMAAKGWAMKEGEAHKGNFGMYKGKWVVIDSSKMYRIPIKK